MAESYKVSVRGKLPEGIFARIASVHAEAIALGSGHDEPGIAGGPAIRGETCQQDGSATTPVEATRKKRGEKSAIGAQGNREDLLGTEDVDAVGNRGSTVI